MSEDELFLEIRKLKYRLQRQGMLELDVWLGSLMQADFSDQEVFRTVSQIIDSEVPELLRMQTGEVSVPEVLKPWL